MTRIDRFRERTVLRLNVSGAVARLPPGAKCAAYVLSEVSDALSSPNLIAQGCLLVRDRVRALLLLPGEVQSKDVVQSKLSRMLRERAQQPLVLELPISILTLVEKRDDGSRSSCAEMMNDPRLLQIGYVG